MNPNKLGEILALIAAVISQAILGIIVFIAMFWVFIQLIN